MSLARDYTSMSTESLIRIGGQYARGYAREIESGCRSDQLAWLNEQISAITQALQCKERLKA